MNTYTIFRAMEVAQTMFCLYFHEKDNLPGKYQKYERQCWKFRDEMVRRCERYDLAKTTIKDLKEQRDQLLCERTIE